MSGGSSSGGSSNDGMVDYNLNRGGTAYGPKDAARETDVSVKHVKGAWHNAHDDSVGDPIGVPPNRHGSSGGGSSSGRK